MKQGELGGALKELGYNENQASFPNPILDTNAHTCEILGVQVLTVATTGLCSVYRRNAEPYMSFRPLSNY